MSQRSPTASPEPLLLARVVRLAGSMRDAALPVSTSELSDAMAALEAIDQADRRQVRAALTTTLVKRVEDRATFEILFDLHLPIRTASRNVDPTRPGGPVRQITTSL